MPMKKYIVYIALGLFLSSTANAQVKESTLGAIVAVEREYTIDLSKLKENLVYEEKLGQWNASVMGINDPDNVASDLSKYSRYQETEFGNVALLVNPHSYKAFVFPRNSRTYTRQHAEQALTAAHQALELDSKTIKIRFLKINR